MEGVCSSRGADPVSIKTSSVMCTTRVNVGFRIFTWVFLLDTAFVIFNNLPPRLVIKEVKMHMAMPEACFQAMTADQCHQQILMFLPTTSLYWKISFRCVFAYLCKDDLPADVQQFLASLGPLNLFALTSGESYPKLKIPVRTRQLTSMST